METALATLQNGISLIRLPDPEPPAGRLLEIAATLGISAYDACYLATAELLGVPLVTEDARLLRVAPQITRSLDSLPL